MYLVFPEVISVIYVTFTNAFWLASLILAFMTCRKYPSKEIFSIDYVGKWVWFPEDGTRAKVKGSTQPGGIVL